MEIVRTKCLTCNNKSLPSAQRYSDVMGSTEAYAQLNRFCDTCQGKILEKSDKYSFERQKTASKSDCPIEYGDTFYMSFTFFTENDVSRFLMDRLSIVADRLKKGLPLTQCMATKLNEGYIESDLQCDRYSTTYVNGLHLCGTHANMMMKHGYIRNVKHNEYSDNNLLKKYADMFLSDMENRTL